MRFDTIIRGGTVATAADTFSCDVGIREGRITALGNDLGTAETMIDATGRLVLPGGIDSHVHFAQPSGDGIVMADGFATGTRSAAFGGNTTVLPFCLQEKGQTLREALRKYHAPPAQYVPAISHIRTQRIALRKCYRNREVTGAPTLRFQITVPVIASSA